MIQHGARLIYTLKWRISVCEEEGPICTIRLDHEVGPRKMVFSIFHEIQFHGPTFMLRFL